jgi:hypothetical protein
MALRIYAGKGAVDAVDPGARQPDTGRYSKLHAVKCVGVDPCVMDSRTIDLESTRLSHIGEIEASNLIEYDIVRSIQGPTGA